MNRCPSTALSHEIGAAYHFTLLGRRCSTSITKKTGEISKVLGCSVIPLPIHRCMSGPKTLTRIQETTACENLADSRKLQLPAWLTEIAAAVAAATLATAAVTVSARAAGPQSAFQSSSSVPAFSTSQYLAISRQRRTVFASISLSQRFHQQSEAICTCVAWINYKILQMMTLPAWGKLLTVLFVAIPILALGSFALRVLTGSDFKAALLRCYLILNNVPGTDIASEEDPRAAVVLNLVYTVGLLTFAALIGVIGDDISSAVDAARLGNSPVVERNHTVVLGHNRQLVEVVRQVALVRADRGATAFPGQLVVLTNKDRASLELTLVEALGPVAAGSVVTRQGSPLKVADLQRISAGHARTVIMLSPEPGDEDTNGADSTAANTGANDASWPDGSEDTGPCCLGLSLEARQSVTLAALHHLREQALRGPGGREVGGEPQTVVVQRDPDLDLLDPNLFSRDGGGGGGDDDCGSGFLGPIMTRHLVTPVSHLNNLSRIQAQCVSQPGLSVVLGSIMQQQQGMPEFYVKHVTEVVGLTYGQARRLFPRAVLCGVYDPAPTTSFASDSAGARLSAAAKAVVLNPPDSTPLLERYSLILLADCTHDLQISKTRFDELTLKAVTQRQQQQDQEHQQQLQQPPSHHHLHRHHKQQQQQQQQQQQHRHLHLHHHQQQQQQQQQHSHHFPHETKDEGDKVVGDSVTGRSDAAWISAYGIATPGPLKQQQQQQLSEARTWNEKPHNASRGRLGIGRWRGLAPPGLGCMSTGTRAERGAAPLRVIVLVFNGQPPQELLEGLADYCPPKSRAIVVTAKDTPASRGPPESFLLPQQRRRLRVSTVIGDPRTRGSLREAQVQDTDAVILTGLEGTSPDKADAQALATLIQLQALMPYGNHGSSGSGTKSETSSETSSLSSSSSSWSSYATGFEAATVRLPPPAITRPPLNLICGVTDPRVKEIMMSLVQVQTGSGGAGGGRVRRQVTIETINPDELLAGVLTQVAAEPRLSGLFHELSMAEGMEVNLRTPAALDLPYNHQLTWDQVQDAGRERDVTVIGLLRASASDATAAAIGSGAMQPPLLLLGAPLGPGAASLEFHAGDKVVVLSGD